MDDASATPELPDHRTYTAMTQEGEAAVGRIAIWAAYVEQHLVDLCAELINEGNAAVGNTVTANMSASSMIQLAKKLLLESDTTSAENKAVTLAALTEAKAALEERNKILHATVGGSLVEGSTTFWNSRRKRFTSGALAGQLEAAQHSPAELDALGARLYKAMDDLWECYLSVSSRGEK
ncbi:hypothetical protein [Arthrobacter globiformis]|nr:hypothetical protein [Arthrobacter globiformis]